MTRPDRLLLLLGTLAAALALWHLAAAGAGITRTDMRVGDIPVTIHRGPVAGPAVVIAHGFAGSRQLMLAIATGLARNGYTAVTFDFPGHGRNPAPLTGDLARIEGATRVLVAATQAVLARARTLVPGPAALLGHSMASDIVVRAAEENPAVAATIAISMFSPAVTATRPRDLLVIVGAWEPGLRAEALRALALFTAPDPPRAGETFGDPANGDARRVDIAPGVEHVSVLYSAATQRAAVQWLDAVFHRTRTTPIVTDDRGRWIALLLGAIVLLARPLAGFLPRVAPAPAGAGLPWRRLWPGLVIPPILTPLALRLLPTHFLPVVVADYLAAHFLLYGLLTLAWLAAIGAWPRAISLPRLALATIAIAAWTTGVLALALDETTLAFLPTAGRLPLIAALLAGTLPFFVAGEWATRGPGAGRLAPVAFRLAFLASLALAVALDFERLFFLAIITPVIIPFLLVHGLFSRFATRATNQPLAAALAAALAFAWALGVTFPLIAG